MCTMTKHSILLLCLFAIVVLASIGSALCNETANNNNAKQAYTRKAKSSSPGMLSSTLHKVMSGLKLMSSKFGTARSGGGGYGGGGYDDEGDDSGLSTLISLLALLLAGLALLAALFGPLIGLLGNNNNNQLAPTIQGGTLSVLPTNPNLAGRRRRDAGFIVDSQGMPEVLALLDDAITRFARLNSGCQNELACGVMKEDLQGLGQITKNFVYLYRALKSSDFSLIRSNPQEYIRTLVDKMASPPKCSEKAKSQC